MKSNYLKVFSTLHFTFFTLIATAQSYLPTADARSIALGGSKQLIGDAYGVFNNAASLAWIEKPTFALSSANRFLLKELSGAGAGFALPAKFGVFGLNINYSGFNKFNRKFAGLSYTQKINNSIALAVKADYLQTSIAEYGNHNSLTADIGVCIKVIKELSFGMNVFNPFMVSGGYYEDEKIPTEFSLGMNYQLSDRVLLIAEESKELNTPSRFHGGIEYKPGNKIFIRGGLSTQPFEYAFGAGFILKKFTVDIASAYHAQLGYSPSLSMKYVFGKK
ncbi:hypothetical protein LBMAG27_01930 [Bacteroidota bacterium]|nr:hypothetical protein LBMAG27_01930 [Bacteroidota bacterium]